MKTYCETEKGNTETKRFFVGSAVLFGRIRFVLRIGVYSRCSYTPFRSERRSDRRVEPFRGISCFRYSESEKKLRSDFSPFAETDKPRIFRYAAKFFVFDYFTVSVKICSSSSPLSVLSSFPSSFAIYLTRTGYTAKLLRRKTSEKLVSSRKISPICQK